MPVVAGVPARHLGRLCQRRSTRSGADCHHRLGHVRPGRLPLMSLKEAGTSGTQARLSLRLGSPCRLCRLAAVGHLPRHRPQGRPRRLRARHAPCPGCTPCPAWSGWPAFRSPVPSGTRQAGRITTQTSGPEELIASLATDGNGSYSFPSVENVSFSGALVSVSKADYFTDTKYILMSQDRQLDFDLERAADHLGGPSHVESGW